MSPKTSELNVEVIQSALQVGSSSCSLCQCSDGDLLQCDLWHCSKCCQISDETMAIIPEIDSIHWFCQPCEIEVFKAINDSAKNADLIFLGLLQMAHSFSGARPED